MLRMNKKRGVSVLELMFAMALLCLVMGAVLLANFNTSYWVTASETNFEALYIAKTKLEKLRAVALTDFPNASSTSLASAESSCAEDKFCYFIETHIEDISACIKSAEVAVSSRVERYPTSTISLSTVFTNVDEALALGGDCIAEAPKGEWAAIELSLHSRSLSASPRALDVFLGLVYLGLEAPPHFGILTKEGAVVFANGFSFLYPVNAIDVARSPSGRVYAYMAVATTSEQFAVVDVTNPAEPALVAKRSLAGVTAKDGEGFRVLYYDETAYVLTRYTGQPELHIFDVSDPTNPSERGSYRLFTSVYDLALREERHAGEQKKVLYLATTHGEAELLVLDVTNPSAVSPISGAATNLPGTQDSRALYLHGNTLYLGRDSVTAGGSDLYALDASKTMHATNGLPVMAHVDVATKASTGRHVAGIRASGPFLFVLTSNTTGSVAQLEVRDPQTLVQKGNAYTFSDPVLRGIDLEEELVYILSLDAPGLRALKSI